MTDTTGRTDRMVASVEHVFSWFQGGSWERHHLTPGIADFTFGNPQELPLPGLVDALQRNAVPGDKDWFAYKMSEAEPRAVVADVLRGRTGIDFEAEDIALTAGAFGALGVTLRALCDVGDEVIFLSPPWFFYELMIASAGATAVRVRLAEPDFDLDPEAIAAAITPRTRAIIVNSPNNPSGRIYRPAELARLGEVLREASARHGRPIVLLSDESYNRIVFDGIDFHSPALDYEASVTIYTYGKTLLAPGQRVGYAALHPAFPDKAAVGYRIFVQQLASGWGFPERAPAARHRRPRVAVGRHPGAPGAARPGRPDPARARLRADLPGGHVLPDGPLAGSRRPGLHRPPGRARRARPAGLDRRVPGLVPHLADRQRRDGRARAGGVPDGSRDPRTVRLRAVGSS